MEYEQLAVFAAT